MELLNSPLMMKAYRDFLEVSRSLDNIDGHDGELPNMRALDPESDEYNDILAQAFKEYLAHCEDFPGRKMFCMEDLLDGGEDPSLYTGKELGIPDDVAVHSNYNQGKTIPFGRGY